MKKVVRKSKPKYVWWSYCDCNGKQGPFKSESAAINTILFYSGEGAGDKDQIPESGAFVWRSKM